MTVFSASAMGDPPITLPTDPSVIPTVPAQFTSAQPALGALHKGALKTVNHRIRLYVGSTHRWQALMGRPLTRSSYRSGSTQSVAYANWVLKIWKARSKRAHAQARHWMVRKTNARLAQIRTWSKLLGMSWFDRQLLGKMNIEDRYNTVLKAYANFQERWDASFLVNAFSCIHSYEGAWNANTGNGYYGGLQMDMGFQSRYGAEFLRRWGTADKWPPWAQFQVAVQAYRAGRGFGPWPNTARYCGLI